MYSLIDFLTDLENDLHTKYKELINWQKDRYEQVRKIDNFKKLLSRLDSLIEHVRELIIELNKEKNFKSKLDSIEQTISNFLVKSTTEGLTEDEKLNLSNLISEKTKMYNDRN